MMRTRSAKSTTSRIQSQVFLSELDVVVTGLVVDVVDEDVVVGCDVVDVVVAGVVVVVVVGATVVVVVGASVVVVVGATVVGTSVVVVSAPAKGTATINVATPRSAANAPRALRRHPGLVCVVVLFTGAPRLTWAKAQ